jgi:hypothetical protein
MLKGKKTYIGIGLLLIPSVLRIFDIQVTEAELQPILENFLTAIGGVVAIYGRSVANK